jgi:murein DD-endopeptidase MepM/ murein hydrolase activator NlpD
MARAPRHLPALIALLAALLVLPAAASLADEQPAAPASATAEAPAATPPSEVPATSSTTVEAPAPLAPATASTPQVQAQHSQGSTRAAPAPAGKGKPKPAAPGSAAAGEEGSEGAAARGQRRPPSPATLTPLLPPGLKSGIAGVPSFFIESFRIPPFLLPIFQAAGTAYSIPWQVLAAINEVETDYGRDLSVSSAGAEGWMQFLPPEWAQYAVDANGDGFKDPYNPADAIFAAARYLHAAGGETNLKGSVFSYNHSQAYVESVMLRAQLLGGTPAELLGAITALTEARFPVHAAAHFSDGFPTVTPKGSRTARTLPGTVIYTQPGAPVIAVQDGEIVQIGSSPALGRFVSLRDAFGNTYTYADLGKVASLYPVLEPHIRSTVSSRIAQAGASGEPAPAGPATAGAQPRSPLSAAGTVSALALGAAAALEPAPLPVKQPSAPAPRPRKPPRTTRFFREGSNDVYLHPLKPGVQVIAGTVLGHVGSGATTSASSAGGEPHILFQIRPAGAGAPLIDPKPILDGWVALENTSIFRAKGVNPFLATSPSTGQVLLESKQQLERQVLHDGSIRLGRCGRDAVRTGRVDRRVLATLEYLSVSGLKPTASGLRCVSATSAAGKLNAGASATSTAFNITAVNGTPVATHQRHGSIIDTTVRELLMLQGASRPSRIVSLMRYRDAPIALVSPRARNAIHVAFSSPSGRGARGARLFNTVLTPSGWARLIARLGEIPDPTVARGPSAAAIPVAGSSSRQGGRGEPGGNH